MEVAMKKSVFFLLLFMITVSLCYSQEYSLQLIIVEPPLTGGNTVTLDPPGGTYPEPTLVTLTPVPIGGYYFYQWGGDLSGISNPATIMVDGPKSVEAWFQAGQQRCFMNLSANSSFYQNVWVNVTYTGDVSGSGRTPFSMGSANSSLSVTLTAPDSISSGGATNLLNSWYVDDERIRPDPVTDLTVTADASNPVLDIVLQYVAPEPTDFPETPAPTPDTTLTPIDGLGDVNEDGLINIVDALLIAQYYVGLNPDINTLLADVNCDGVINIIDALLIAQYYVGLVDSFC
jgi:hypothetical protein